MARNYFDLTGRSALVTGAAGGIGAPQSPPHWPTRARPCW